MANLLFHIVFFARGEFRSSFVFSLFTGISLSYLLIEYFLSFYLLFAYNLFANLPALLMQVTSSTVRFAKVKILYSKLCICYNWSNGQKLLRLRERIEIFELAIVKFV